MEVLPLPFKIKECGAYQVWFAWFSDTNYSLPWLVALGAIFSATDSVCTLQVKLNLVAECVLYMDDEADSQAKHSIWYAGAKSGWDASTLQSSFWRRSGQWCYFCCPLQRYPKIWSLPYHLGRCHTICWQSVLFIFHKHISWCSCKFLLSVHCILKSFVFPLFAFHCAIWISVCLKH